MDTQATLDRCRDIRQAVLEGNTHDLDQVRKAVEAIEADAKGETDKEPKRITKDGVTVDAPPPANPLTAPFTGSVTMPAGQSTAQPRP